MAKNIFEIEKKVLLGFSGSTVFGILLMFVSFSTDYWMILTIPGGEHRNASHAYVTGHHSGLWRICREELDNRSRPVINSESFTPDKLFIYLLSASSNCSTLWYGFIFSCPTYSQSCPCCIGFCG